MNHTGEKEHPVIHWFRKDLRVTDNPALFAAAEKSRPVIAVYILEDGDSDPWAPRGASRWWLHHSLAGIDETLGSYGNRLLLRCGNPPDVLAEIARETGAAAVHFNRLSEPHAKKTETEVERVLTDTGIGVRAFDGSLLFPPESVATGKGDCFRVFTPFYRACLKKLPLRSPLPAPREISRPEKPLRGDSLSAWNLLPQKPDRALGWLDLWTPGERGALVRIDSFLENSGALYKTQRDRPDVSGTSKLSPHLHFGEISPRLCWHSASRNLKNRSQEDCDSFLRQLIWREFSHHLLYHRPEFPDKPFRKEFERFPWKDNEELLDLWQRGLTGYPIVDAGMRQLLTTGWMHNRVRMVAASFLVKHLLIPWQRGAEWFFETLVDADLANNSVSWQWVAGCGVDAAPFFRIFNPTLQGKKFDPEGDYVRRWIPELKNVSNLYTHEPWKGSGRGSYPVQIVDHSTARKKALFEFESLKNLQTD